MEFNGQYLTYNEYQSLGGTLAEMPFNLLEFKARKEIDKYTFGRLEEIGNGYNEVKLCVNDIIGILDLYSDYDNQDKRISSVNTDGYVESYNLDISGMEKSKDDKIKNIIYNYLSNLYLYDTPILYRG